MYYQSAMSGLLVPVKKTGQTSAKQTVETMLGSPGTDSLLSLLPPDTRILGVELDENGVLNIDLSREFTAIRKEEGQLKLLLRGLDLTCRGMAGVKRVRLLVEGQTYAIS